MIGSTTMTETVIRIEVGVAAQQYLPDELRGTYAGLAHPAFVDHLKRLGVTTLELLPVHAFTHEEHLVKGGRDRKSVV